MCLVYHTSVGCRRYFHVELPLRLCVVLFVCSVRLFSVSYVRGRATLNSSTYRFVSLCIAINCRYPTLSYPRCTRRSSLRRPRLPKPPWPRPPTLPPMHSQASTAINDDWLSHLTASSIQYDRLEGSIHRGAMVMVMAMVMAIFISANGQLYCWWTM